ncbi:MAG: PIN domain-containing protein [Patescibacteria group bacterium]|mgnify:CR=1 FL=1
MGEERKIASQEDEGYFFDSYAIIEILEQNPNYEKYKESEATLTVFNLAEIYYSCLDGFNKEELEEIYSKYKESVVEIDDETLKEAMRFRKEHRKKNLSYTDCIGYIYAQRHNMKFLTGDKEFHDLSGVEFVK